MPYENALILNDALLAEAMRQTGVKEKTAVVHLGLQALIQRESAAGSRRWAVRCLGWTFRRAGAAQGKDENPGGQVDLDTPFPEIGLSASPGAKPAASPDSSDCHRRIGDRQAERPPWHLGGSAGTSAHRGGHVYGKPQLSRNAPALRVRIGMERHPIARLRAAELRFSLVIRQTT